MEFTLQVIIINLDLPVLFLLWEWYMKAITIVIIVISTANNNNKPIAPPMIGGTGRIPCFCVADTII